MLPWWIRWACGWQKRTGMFQTGNAILTYLKEHGSFIWKRNGPCSSRSTFVQNQSLTVYHWKFCRWNFQVFQYQRSLRFMGLGPGELWGICHLFGGRGCMNAVAIEIDKIFNQLTSCTKSEVEIHYPLWNQHFICDSFIEFVVRNCIFSALVII